MAEWCSRCGVEIWAYCLMPNHVHLIAVPSSEGNMKGHLPYFINFLITILGDFTDLESTIMECSNDFLENL
jgi:REP element-mobilizing transposase RayT